MDRKEWMYKILRVSNYLVFLGYMRKFVAAAKKAPCAFGSGAHHLSVQ